MSLTTFPAKNCFVRVALFVTCLVDQVAPATGRSTVQLLEENGCEVVFPEAQTCCGQPALNSGFPNEARRLARHFIEVFEDYDAIIAPSGSCVAMVRNHYPDLFEGAAQARAEAVASRTFELTQYIVEILERGGPPHPKPSGEAVTYHASCHLLRELGVVDPPRVLLAEAGVVVDEMADPDRCCGFGGTFSLDHPELAVPMADAKLDQAQATGARTIVACDTGCIVHLAARARRRGLAVEVRHVADVLAERSAST
jgi:L-lactate dehydrogenase complex protein LldE